MGSKCGVKGGFFFFLRRNTIACLYVRGVGSVERGPSMVLEKAGKGMECTGVEGLALAAGSHLFCGEGRQRRPARRDAGC